MKVKTLIDTLEFECAGWEDPELMGIKEYILYTSKNGGTKTPMLTVAKFDQENLPTIRIGTGTISYSVEIVDVWGAKASYTIAENIETVLPSDDERIAFEESGIKENAIVL